MKEFIAIIINMGLITKRSIASYWSTRPCNASPWFGTVMSRNRFQLILRYLHVEDVDRIPPRNSPHYKPDSRYRGILQFVNRMFMRYYVPKQNVAVDESLVATRGRTAMLQYIPTKSAKFRVKFWVHAESASGYIMRMTTYLGRVFEPPTGGLQGTDVVIKLLRECRLLQKGYHVTVDSFFCSLDLARRLLSFSMYLTGTMRSNRQLPDLIKNANPNPGHQTYARQGRIMLVAHKDAGRRKPVRVLSTAVNARDDNGRPAAVEHYNKTMGAVDYGDMLMSFYNAERKTIKVWKKMVVNLIFRITLNSYVLYQQTVQRPVSRERFMEMLVEALAEETVAAKRRGTHTPYGRQPRTNGRRRLVPLRGRTQQRDCCVCSRRSERRRRSSLVCSVCERGVHRLGFNGHVCLEE